MPGFVNHCTKIIQYYISKNAIPSSHNVRGQVRNTKINSLLMFISHLVIHVL